MDQVVILVGENFSDLFTACAASRQPAASPCEGLLSITLRTSRRKLRPENENKQSLKNKFTNKNYCLIVNYLNSQRFILGLRSKSAESSFAMRRAALNYVTNIPS